MQQSGQWEGKTLFWKVQDERLQGEKETIIGTRSMGGSGAPRPFTSLDFVSFSLVPFEFCLQRIKE